MSSSRLDLFSLNNSSTTAANITASAVIFDVAVNTDRRDLRHDDPCGHFRFWWNAVVIGVLCLAGLVGNTAAIFALRRDREHNRVAAFLLQSLAVADNLVLMVAFVVMTMFFGWLPVIDSALIVNALPYLVKYVNPLGPIVQSLSIWTTVVLSVNRYIAVCRPFSAAKLLTMRAARVQIAVVLFVSVSLNIPRFFTFDIVYLRDGGNRTTTSYTRSNLGHNKLFEVIYYNIFYITCVLILPLIILVILNTSLVRQLRASKQRMERNSLGYTGQAESNITVVMIIIVVGLVVCHTPDRIIEVVRALVYDDPKTEQCPAPIFYASQISSVLIIFSSATDFVVYYIFRRRFRMILRDRLCQMFTRCTTLFDVRRRKREPSTISERIAFSSTATAVTPPTDKHCDKQNLELDMNRIDVKDTNGLC